MYTYIKKFGIIVNSEKRTVTRKKIILRKGEKMKKTILIVIAIIIVLALVVFEYMVFSDIRQEQKLNEEFEEISTLVNAEQLDMDKINEKLDRTVTTGDYAVVEKAFKQYLSDNFDNMIKISEIIEDDRIVNCLTAENYKQDGPGFEETKAYIEGTKKELQECKEKYINFFTEKKAMSYINDKELDSYYIDYYKSEFVGDIESDNDSKEVENSIDEIISVLDITEEVINFLSENKDFWKIEDDMIVFDNDNMSAQYDELVAQL